MIIDSHTHLGRPGGEIEARVTDLLKSMDAAQIDMAAVFAGRIGSISTDDVLKEISPYKDRLFAVGSVAFIEADADYADWTGKPHLDKMRGYLEIDAIKAIKFYTGYEHYYPDNYAIRPFLNLLQKFNRPAIFHSGDTYCKSGTAKLKYAMPIHIDDLAVEMPDLKIIIAHMGYPWQRETAEVMYKNKNVYTDCSGFVYGNFTSTLCHDYKDIWPEFGKVAGGFDKILFGSDWPISNQDSYRSTTGWVINSIFPYTESLRIKELIFEGNAKKLFGL